MLIVYLIYYGYKADVPRLPDALLLRPSCLPDPRPSLSIHVFIIEQLVADGPHKGGQKTMLASRVDLNSSFSLRTRKYFYVFPFVPVDYG